MVSAILLVLAVSGASAFPSLVAINDHLKARDVARSGCKISALCDKYVGVTNAEASIPATPNAATKVSASRTNCGLLGSCAIFNAEEQYVSTSGEHAYQSPSATDIRGPCPGLNAAANHGYLPRNGILNIADTTLGLQMAYNFADDFSAFLAVFSIVVAGDIPTLTWSIGGPLPTTLLSGTTGDGQGISYSHNIYEGDTSITRCDAYTNGGDAHSSSMTRYTYAYEYALQGDSLTLDKISQLYAKNTVRSISQNPEYFAPLVSTTVVSPGAYFFVINFMSNHSAEVPGGYLNLDMFNTFFSVTGKYPHFTWQKGQERIPENWYKRPNENPYGAVGLVGDLVSTFAAYPDSFRFGGNVNGVNSYTGIDIANITGGAYNADTLLEGDNLACFIVLNLQEVTPLQLQGLVNDVGAAMALLLSYLPAGFKNLQCPQVAKYDTSFTSPYAGASYKLTAPPAGPKNC